MRAALPLVTALLVLAAPAHAGQIVFPRGSGEDQMQLWTMDDRGRGARMLVDNAPLRLSTLREAAVSRDGRTIAFSGHTNRNAGEHAAHTVARRGRFAPDTSSPAWSPDGSRLVAVDRPGDETTEIWTFNADGTDQRLVLTAPAGVAIRTVTYMGAGRLLFDVSFDNGTDLWSVPTSCSACAFPAGVTRVTNNGTSRDPAWTPAARMGGNPLMSVRAVRAARGIALRLGLSQAARVRIAVGRAGTVTRRLRAGTRTVRIARVRGRALRPGRRYRVVVRVVGAPARTLTVRAR